MFLFKLVAYLNKTLIKVLISRTFGCRYFLLKYIMLQWLNCSCEHKYICCNNYSCFCGCRTLTKLIRSFEKYFIFRNSTSAGPNGPRRMSGSMGRLHKKWRSTSDFDPPTPAPLSIYKKPAAGKGKLNYFYHSELILM